MPLRFDAALKDLGCGHPHAFLSTFDAPPTDPVAVLNVDLSTVTTAADVVYGIGNPLREIVHLDFQSSASADKHVDILAYNALLYRHYRVPVHSIVILLRPQAAHPNLDGTVAYTARAGRGKMDFGYERVPLWERPAEELLAGELGAVPLATLGRLPADVPLVQALTSVVQRIIERLQKEAPPDQLRHLVTAAYVLTGLRVPRDVALPMFQGVQGMRDSDTYLAIVDEGVEKGQRRLLRIQLEKRFGPLSPTAQQRLDGWPAERLEELSVALLDAPSLEALGLEA
jgi:hypothetical protein